MARPRGLGGIAFCYFAVYQRDGSRKLKIRRIIILGAAPIAIGVLLAIRLGAPSGDKLSLIVAVLSVVAAVLIGLLPLAHSILAQTEIGRSFKIGERALVQQSLDRVQVLQDLHASISWAVVLLVIGLAASATLVLLGVPIKEEAPRLLKMFEIVLLFVLYGVMASTAMTFFDVSTGVYEAMESHAESIKARVREGVQTSTPPDIEE